MATNKKVTTKKNVENITKVKDKSKPNCFIIMPFGGWFNRYHKEIYIEAIENAGFVAKRADDLYRPGNIVNDIWKYTKDADIILADLTNKNPNVFYELGLAHAITKPAVLITASMDDVPFDLRSLRVLVYDKNARNWGEQLKVSITKALTETLKNPEDALPSTFLETEKPERLEVTPQEKDILELKQELDSLKREIRLNRKSLDIEYVLTDDTVRELIKKSFLEDRNENEIANKIQHQETPSKHYFIRKDKKMEE